MVYMRKIKIVVCLLPVLLLLPIGYQKASGSGAGHRELAADTVKASFVLNPPFLDGSADKWVDSVMKKLTPDERIGQLFMVAAWSNKNQAHVTEINNLIKNQKIGGLIFMQGGPVRQAKLCNQYQKNAKVPLMIGMDAEFGLSMRLDSTIQFPREMTMGAAENDSLVYLMGSEMARQCKRLGVHVSFSPVADINNNPRNPVIGTRSFGENKMAVTSKSMMYMKGLQDNGVLACGKHFPGHGDTDSDSHKTLPQINHSKERLDSLELYPFRELIKNGLGSMMVAHLSIPALDTAVNTPTTLSKKVVSGLLKEEMGFQGLIFTDAMNMKGVAAYFSPGQMDVKALVAGNDVLLFSSDVPKAITMIKTAISKGELTQAEIDASCRKILAAKYWCGLAKHKLVKLKNLSADLNTPEAEWIRRRILEQSITLVQNKNQLIPFQRLDTLQIASLAIGKKNEYFFQQRLSMYAPMYLAHLERDASKVERDSAIARLKKFDCIILSLHGINQTAANNFGVSATDQFVLDTLLQMGKTIVLDLFGPPYAMNALSNAHACAAVLISFENQEYIEDLSAQLIFGGIGARGHLPVSLNDWLVGTGVRTAASRLKYTVPEEIGFSRTALARIDSIVAKGIKEHAYPGCQVFAAKNGNVFLNKSYGHFTYDKTRAVLNTDLYDVASVTKIVATVPAVMGFVDKHKLNLDTTLSVYLPELKGTNKEHLLLREMLAHQAGLKAWIPFWIKTTDKSGNLRKDIYRKMWSDSFPVYVAPNLFISRNYKDSIYKAINESALENPHQFLYSDLGYYYLKAIIEKDAHMLLSDYMMKNYYQPLGLTTMGYQPRLRFPSSRCAPTENDIEFRHQQLQGDVHDQGAAMLGGIGGHAGVFSNANDVGVMMQLFLNGGTYGGYRYFDSATVNEFTRAQYPNNRRGIGFDKPEPDTNKPNPACDSISLSSFGHQGFTGTQAWADPETGIVFVFLSNRVYPETKPNKLAQMGIRGQILQVLVEEN
jgi:beta-N-acetylhexosaminidase